MSQKRRILVAFQDVDLVGGEKRMVILMDANSTVADLSREVASRTNKSRVKLSLDVGYGSEFELADKDDILVIGDGELVKAVATTSHILTPLASPSDVALTKPRIDILKLFNNPFVAEPSRLKIRFITAEMARDHAKDSESSTRQPKGVLAFGGAFVNGDITLSALQQEAAQVLGWLSENLVVSNCNCTHEEKETACSCAIAQEVERKGLFSSLHCRFTIDGTRCINPHCPYSHVAVISGSAMGSTAPHCAVCTEALGFPCPTCMDRAITSDFAFDSVVLCPLVQNAGCGHLHHAHCLGDRSDSTVVCPSGCPRERFPREADLLGSTQRHIIIIWDGDKVDIVPLPEDNVRGDIPPPPLTTSRTIRLVEDFLESKNLAVPGLSVRIHSRDATAEVVRFTRSTMVSVCPVSAHTNQNYQRFDLFINKVKEPKLCTQIGSVQIDFHTAESPIAVCGCTRLKELFPPDFSCATQLPVTLYAVKRTVETQTSDLKHSATSKEQTYLADCAWQPSVDQSPRGMAALLSSLYLLAHSVARMGTTAEHNVLAMLHAITRFPPALRTLGILFLNRIPEPQARAALSEALYHSLKDFVPLDSRGPGPISSNPNRLFEAVRIFIAHIIGAADVTPAMESTEPLLEDVSLICAVSRKRLTDPIVMNGLVVERSLSTLYQPGGHLHHPLPTLPLPAITEVDEKKKLQQLLNHSKNLLSSSIFHLHSEKIGLPPPSCTLNLGIAGWDFTSAIQRANETELRNRDPLELKSVSVIAPQITLDEDGLLAVFTGRGGGGFGDCGVGLPTRDVTFFRPTNGGDTGVDVNDVSYALQRVIDERKAENTWQVDCFGGVEGPIQPPDEAIVLCLDLSESMNASSGVSKFRAAPSDRTVKFDHERAALKAVEDIVGEVPGNVILLKAKEYLDNQLPSCHHAWKLYVHDDFDLSVRLIKDLGKLATRDVLRLSCVIEESSSSASNDVMIELAHFANASVHQSPALAEYLLRLLEVMAINKLVGVEPYAVPLDLLDPTTGDLLTDPVSVTTKKFPYRTIIINSSSKHWFESQHVSPSGYIVPSHSSPALVREDVARWTTGNELLQMGQCKSTIWKTFIRDDTIVAVTLEHDSRRTTWNLHTSEPTRTLYSLAHRVTGARYSSFTLRNVTSKVPVNDSASLTLGLTELSLGGIIEMARLTPHTRTPYKVDVQFKYGYRKEMLLLPCDASALSVLSYLPRTARDNLSDFMLRHGMRDVGDGVRRGTIVTNQSKLREFSGRAGNSTVVFECQDWFYHPSGAQKGRETSRHLSRLVLLKELFNVFLNRVGSFDTSVPLVVGLVTFSDEAIVKQQLTPIFENFRLELESVSARGNTVVYDALETARGILTNFRKDLRHLRRRIIIVTDGADTNSGTPAWIVCSALQKAKILVDSVQVGTQSDKTLHAISLHKLSWAPGGYRFAPQTTLGDALSIFDLETMLNSAERTSRLPMPHVPSDFRLREYGNTHVYPVDVVSVDEFPQRAEHAKLRKSVKPVGISIVAPRITNDRTKRIMRELAMLVADPHPQVDIYINDSDMTFFKVILEAPKDANTCVYQGGTFLLTCDLVESYPRNAPQVRFVTFILHPNVSKQGKVCFAKLGRLWSSEITLKEIFTDIYGLLLEPDLDSPVETYASMKYYDDDGTYALAVANAVTKHASRTREQWKTELHQENPPDLITPNYTEFTRYPSPAFDDDDLYA